jgi:hypothetical protein
MSRLNHQLLNELGASIIGLTDTNPVIQSGNNASLIPYLHPELPVQEPANKRIGRLLEEFTFFINNGKTLRRQEWAGKLLGEINMELFGFMGDAQLHADESDPFPRAHFLHHTKGFFHVDVEKIISLVSKWDIRGHRVYVNEDLQFDVSNESLGFFDTLKWMGQLNDGTGNGRFAMRNMVNRLVGVYPGERWSREISAQWKPEETIALVRKSLSQENTINRVGGIINDVKGEQAIMLPEHNYRYSSNADHQAMDQYGYVESNSLNDLKDIQYVDFNRRHLVSETAQQRHYSETCFDLKVEKVTHARDFRDHIPEEIVDHLETFLNELEPRLTNEVPFILTPELVILEGPVTMKTTRVIEYKDPLLIMRFREFPRMLVPVAYWLPVSMNHIITGYGKKMLIN